MNVGFKFFVFLCFIASIASAQPLLTIEKEEAITIGKYCSILEDKNRTLSIEDVVKLNNEFVVNDQEVYSPPISHSAIWIKFDVLKKSNQELLLEIGNPTIDRFELYKVTDNNIEHVITGGDEFPYHHRNYKINTFIVDPKFPNNQKVTYYLRYHSTEALFIPLTIISHKALLEDKQKVDLSYGVMYGVMVVMIIYNFFLFIALRDRSYLYYILYIVFFGLTQTGWHGTSFEYLWPDSPWFNNQSVFIFPSLCGIFAMFFVRSFLQTKERLVHWNKVGYVMQSLAVIPVIVSLCSSFLPQKTILWNEYLVVFNTIIFSPYMIIMGVKVYNQGYKPARFFLFAWVTLLVGISIYVLKSIGLLPHNFFTDSMIRIGFVMENILLSFALGDRYNQMKKEHENAQNEIIKMLMEKEKIKDQINKELEKKVNERTQELTLLNNQLEERVNQRTTELNKAYSDLVEINKELDTFIYRSSHDIKGPITTIMGLCNVAMMDVGDKKAQQYFTKVFQTSEQTQNMLRRIVSISEIKKIHPSKAEIDFETLIDSVLCDLKKHDPLSHIQFHIDVPEKDFGFKSEYTFLQQILKHLIENSIRYMGNENEPKISVVVTRKGDMASIVVSDNGNGIDDKYKDKVFDMFFRGHENSTGSGLGLYIVKLIAEKLKGSAQMTGNKPGEVTFEVLLPFND
ncbi:MAG TPA: sensor histidine kinase [Cytophagaceae bacterium]